MGRGVDAGSEPCLCLGLMDRNTERESGGQSVSVSQDQISHLLRICIDWH